MMKFDAKSRESERERVREGREREGCESVDYRKMKGKCEKQSSFTEFVKIKKNPLAFAS